MFLPQQDSFVAIFSQALTKPIEERCADLATFIDRGNLKDLHSVFPMLIDNIFGPLGGGCWDLGFLTESNSIIAFNAVRRFLSPHGSMFKLIYSLLRDSMIKFSFNLKYLPMQVRESTKPTTTHPFYMDLINVDVQTNETVSLMLNPFDYYFFHFAYYLINPMYQQQQFLETVYYVLYCDYLYHYLPNDPSIEILPNLHFYHGKNPFYTLPSLNKPAKTSKLLRTDLFSANSIEPIQHHPRNEVWRSETVMTVFIDMWFANDLVLNSNFDFDSSFNTPFKQMFRSGQMPSAQYIRFLRILVKHLHRFANSANADNTHLGDLKRIVIPYFQGKVYVLLRHLIYSWPLDGSFRLVLELWFSFIQPWRYPPDYFKVNQRTAYSDNEDMNMVINGVTREHMTFLTENLLAYTVLLQQLLPRFSKVDLASPKIALILYRTCKVFAQPHLISYLRDIEESILQANSVSPIHSYNSVYSPRLPPLSPTSQWSTNNTIESKSTQWKDTINTYQSNVYSGASGKWGTIVKQRILKYEGPYFCYKPIFIGPTPSEVHEIISHIQNSQQMALKNVQIHMRKKQEQSGFFGLFKSAFSSNDYLQDDFTEEERKRVPIYLDWSLRLLSGMFYPTGIVQQSTSQEVQSKSIDSDFDVSNPRHLLDRIKRIKYEGDPDLRPIQSYEIAVLVRMLYRLSVKLNSQYGSEMRDLYYSSSWSGWFLRRILCPPVRIYRYDKSSPGASKRVSEDLPPRISLRYFANFWFIFYSILALFLMKYFGFKCVVLFLIIFMVWGSYVVVKSINETREDYSSANLSMGSSTSMEMRNESF